MKKLMILSTLFLFMLSFAAPVVTMAQEPAKKECAKKKDCDKKADEKKACCDKKKAEKKKAE